jgi:hypothetical protein
MNDVTCRTYNINGKMRKIYKILVGKPEGKRPFERCKHIGVVKLKMDIRQTGYKGCGLD